MSRPVVSVVKYSSPYQSLREALKSCDGLADLNKGDKILIKPNLVTWDFVAPFSPFGVVTTSAVVFALVQILAEEGFNKLSIGEASIPVPRTIGTLLYKTLGYEKLKEDYGVNLIDFSHEKFEVWDFDGLKLSIARNALNADKIISVPVLKTHTQCKVSLGIKNLKGCLNQKSKMACHVEDRILDHTFPHLVDRLPLALTVIDGIFALEKGPLQSGRAHRKDLLIASRDVYAADVVGAALLGYIADEVPHLQYFAKNHGRSTSLADIRVAGENIESHRSYLAHDWEWTGEDTGPVEFNRHGITGLAVRKSDTTLCTGCSIQYSPMLFMLMQAYKGTSLPKVEVITGKKREAAGGFEKTVLFGNCAAARNKNNPNIKKAVPVKGCPPDLREFERIMKEEGINCNFNDYAQYRSNVLKRYTEREGFDPGLYHV